METIIKLPVIDLLSQKMRKVKEMSLTLYPTHYEHILIFRADENESEDEHVENWVERITNLKTTILKTSICGVEKAYKETSDVFGIHIFSNSNNSYPSRLYFRTEKEAEEVYQKILNWILS